MKKSVISWNLPIMVPLILGATIGILVLRYQNFYELNTVSLLGNYSLPNHTSKPIDTVNIITDSLLLLLVAGLLSIRHWYTVLQKKLTKQIINYQYEREQAQAVTKQLLQEREIFLANISHNIRTPLNAILGFSELLAQDQSNSTDNTYLKDIRSSGNTLLTLMDELLDLSKIESGQLTLDYKPIRLSDILEAVAADTTRKATDKHLRYDIQVDPAVPKALLADNQRLTQVLLLISNSAVEFTEKGYVRLYVQLVQLDQSEQVELLFTIEDSGIGFAEDKLQHAFDCFGQVSDQGMFRSAGTGLGLHIARHLVTLMNGTVSIRSELGHGTTVSVQIPFDLPVIVPFWAPKPFLARSLYDLSASTKGDVLIVEDNIMNQKVLEGYLKRHQMKSTIANNGLEAVEILKRASFDLIFMDVQMPEMDGYTATKAIRQEMALTTPIIAMTAYTMAGERERCLAVGMDEYLSKPIHRQQLNNTLARFAPTIMEPQENIPENNPANMGAGIVQESYLNELMDGDDELLTEMVLLFEQDLPSYRQTLFEAIKENDQPLFARISHKFRSSLNALAMLNTAKKLKELEADNTFDKITKATQLTNLFSEINHGLAFLKKRIDHPNLK